MSKNDPSQTTDVTMDGRTPINVAPAEVPTVAWTTGQRLTRPKRENWLANAPWSPRPR